MRLHFVNIPSRFSEMAVSQHTTILQNGFANFMPQVTFLATIVNNIVAVANNKTKQSKLIIYASQSSLPSLTNLLSYLGKSLISLTAYSTSSAKICNNTTICQTSRRLPRQKFLND